MTEPAAEGPTDPAPGAQQAPIGRTPVEQAPIDPHESEPRPASLLARIRLFFYRTTLGRTRKDKNEA